MYVFVCTCVSTHTRIHSSIPALNEVSKQYISWGQDILDKRYLLSSDRASGPMLNAGPEQ